jgi:hypothetical protein
MSLNAAFYLSLVLALAGCTGLVLAGKGKWYGWAVGLAVQPVWIVFGIVTKGYGLCLTALLYGAVYSRNLLAQRASTASDAAPAHD